MRVPCRWLRTRRLRNLSREIFATKDFSQFKTRVAIVATNWRNNTPFIFKSNAGQAHGRKSTFVAGFGRTIAEAIEASCAAYPFFSRKKMKASVGELVELIDGGYCANNPTLYAIADALVALRVQREDLRILSLGVGSYPRPNYRLPKRWAYRFFLIRLLQKTLDVNTASMERLQTILFPDLKILRINESFSQPELACDFAEYRLEKLDQLYQQGSGSFAKFEAEIRSLLDLGTV
jgi:predicted acylesterase/phospholipase RssA